MVLFFLPFPASQVEQQSQALSQDVFDENSSRQAARLISVLNGRNEGALIELLGTGFSWYGGDQFGDADSFLKIYREHWANLKGWRIVPNAFGKAYLVDGLLQNTVPGKNAKVVIPLVQVKITEEYENPYTKDGLPKVVHNYPIYLAFQGSKLMRVIAGPSSATP